MLSIIMIDSIYRVGWELIYLVCSFFLPCLGYL